MQYPEDMESLFKEFTPSSYEDWQKQVLKDLKGEPLESLLWENENGFTIQPFYTKEHLKKTANPIFTHCDWEVCEYIFVEDEAKANRQALDALTGGASGLVFEIVKPINSQILLKGISTEHIYTQFNISNDAVHIINDLKFLDGKINAHTQQMQGFIALDPIHLLCKYGEWHSSIEKDMSTQLNRPYLSVNASLYHEAGAYAATQLGLMLAHLNEYLYFLNEQKANFPEVIHLNFSIGSSFFTEIAKLKSARHLVSLLLSEYNGKASLHIHAQTGLINKSHKDSNTNLLRTTTENMSAILGGCNSLTTLPFEKGFKADTGFSQRIARNQQLILKGESYMNQLADVSAGSYYVENLMDALGEKAWEVFKSIENEGGFIKAFENGAIQKRITRDFEAQKKAVDTGKKVIVGATKFQNTSEPTPASYLITPTFKSSYEAIVPKRLA